MLSVENVIADLNSARDHMKERSVDSLHIKIMEYGIRLHETRLIWLDDFLKEVEKCRK